MWPIVEHEFSTKVGGWKFCSSCDLCSIREHLPKFGVIKKEEGKEFGNSIEGALEEYGGQWVGGLNGLLGDAVSFI